MKRACSGLVCVFAMSVPGLGCGQESGAGAETDSGAEESSATSTSGESESAEATATGGDGDGDADGVGDGDGDGDLACNGWVELCTRGYDEVAFPGTHNSNSATEYGYGVFNANHDHGLTRQLEDGVRLMLIDVTYDEGETTLCHGPCNLGSTPHIDGLAELKTFLDANPREVLTIIYQDSISVEDMEADWETSGMIDLVYAHAPGSAWPTLGEMIDGGTRVVVTAEAGGPPPAWFHHVWDVGWDTGYSWGSLEEMNCDLNRGSLDNDLFLVNHWVNNTLGLPDKGQAATSNSKENLLARLEECRNERGHIPNFVAVDFYDQGDLFGAVAALNGLE